MNDTKTESLVAQTWRLWKQLCLPLALVALLPYLLLWGTSYILGQQLLLEGAGPWVYYTVSAAAFLLFWGGELATNAVAFAAAAALSADQALCWRTILKSVKERYLSFLGTSLLNFAMISLGMIAFIIPGIIVMINYSLAYPVFFAEGTNASCSLDRSRALVKGVRWRIAGYMAALVLASWLVMVTVQFATALLPAMMQHDIFDTALAQMATMALAPAFYTALYRVRLAAAPLQAVELEEVEAQPC